MLDLERFTEVPEDERVLWNIWAKVGDTGPGDEGLKDGELTQAYPATPGVDSYGAPYGYVGSKDLTGYVIFQLNATKETIRDLFQKPAKNSNAYKRNRKNYSFIDLDEVFNMAEVSHYRDHSRQVPILKNFNIARISDYRNRPKRLDKPFVHGSEVSGTWTVGGTPPAVNYADLKTAMDDVGAVGSNTIEFVIVGANSPGANIDFDKVTNSDGLIHIHSTLYNYRSNPLITGSGKWWQMDGRCNYLIEHIMVNGMSFHYDSPTSGSTGRTHTIRCVTFDRTTNHDPIYPNINDPGTPITIEFYGNVILGRSTASGARCNDFYISSGWTGPVWADNMFFANNTFILERNYTEAGATVTGTNINCSFANNAIYQSVGTNAWDNNLSSATVTLNNCARNKALVGTITENSCITDLMAADFLATTITDADAGKIDENSRLYDAGSIAGLVSGYTKDILGNDINLSAPQIGAFSAYTTPIERNPVDSISLKDTAVKNTVLEIDISEHITGLALFSGAAYFKNNYFRDDFNCYNGDKISVFKKINSLEVEGIALTEESSSANVVSNAGTWWQDTANETLYVHFTEGDSPSNHTVVAHFTYYVSDTSLILTADSDTRHFEPYLDPKSMPNITQRFNEALIGAINISGGIFSLLNGNGLFDQLIDKYIWTKRNVTIKRGYDTQSYANYTTMNVVTITGWTITPTRVKFKVKNRHDSLFEEIPAQTFASTDSDVFGVLTYGATYPEELLGKPKPLAWGEFGERLAPVLHMIREDTSLVSFGVNYSTASKTDSNMTATAPAYNPNVTFTATGITANDDGNIRSFIPTQNSDYFNQEEGFYKGYYIRVDSLGQQAKISGYSYNRNDDKAEISLDTTDTDNQITSTGWSNFKIYSPVYHYFVANHIIKSIDTVYVDKGGDDGVKEWDYLADDSGLVGSSWTRLVLAIPGFSSSTKVRAAFKSKDVDLGGSAAKETLENHSDVVEDILINANVLSSPFVAGDLDSTSFSNSATDRNYPVAIYLDEATRAINVISKIRQSVIAKLMLTNDGKFKYVAWNPEDPVAAGIEDLTISEILGDPSYSSDADNIYYGFIIRHSPDGQDDSYLEERYVYEPTKYLYRTTQTRTIETYLRSSSKALTTAQRYTYFNRNVITNVSLSVPHNLKRDGTTESTLSTPGEYLRVTVERAPGQETAYGDEFGQYRKTYEVLSVKDNSKTLEISGDNIKGLSINAGYWSNSDGDDPTGYWTNTEGESVDGDDSTKNTSLWT
jgi:hypothetical protein